MSSEVMVIWASRFSPRKRHASGRYLIGFIWSALAWLLSVSNKDHSFEWSWDWFCIYIVFTFTWLRMQVKTAWMMPWLHQNEPHSLKTLLSFAWDSKCPRPECIVAMYEMEHRTTWTRIKSAKKRLLSFPSPFAKTITESLLVVRSNATCGRFGRGLAG